MIKAKLGHGLDALVRKLLPFLFRRPVNPNALTVAGTLVSLAAASAFAMGEFPWGGVLLGFAGFFDLVDGAVARHHGITTTWGAFLDSTLDRVADMVVLLGLVLHFAVAGEFGVVLLAAWALVATVLVSYSKARAERFVGSFEGGFLERAERVVILILGGLSGFVVLALWAVAIGSTVTVLQRFAHAYREMARLDAASQEAGGH